MPVSKKLLISFAIIGYLIFMGAAGFFNLLRLPYAEFFYPWSNFGMFSSYPSYHAEIIAEGVDANGAERTLPMSSFFPMPHTLIERGQATGITSFLRDSNRNLRSRAAKKLCSYVLKEYNNSADHPASHFRAVEIKILFAPFEEGQFLKKEIVLAQCP